MRVDNYPTVPITEAFENAVTATNTQLITTLQAYDSTIQQIRYTHGNWFEVMANLREWEQNETEKYKRFPLVALIEDISIQRGQNAGEYGRFSNVTLVIANLTNPAFKSADRETKNFAPILVPIYNELLVQLAKSKAFNYGSARKIVHTMTKRKLWGANDNTANKLGAYIDAIEITGLEGSLSWNYCVRAIDSNITI